MENVEAARTRWLVAMPIAPLVTRLDRHGHPEETQVTDANLDQFVTGGATKPAAWALPLPLPPLLGDGIALDAATTSVTGSS